MLHPANVQQCLVKPAKASHHVIQRNTYGLTSRFKNLKSTNIEAGLLADLTQMFNKFSAALAQFG